MASIWRAAEGGGRADVEQKASRRLAESEQKASRGRDEGEQKSASGRRMMSSSRRADNEPYIKQEGEQDKVCHKHGEWSAQKCEQKAHHNGGSKHDECRGS